jgi:hypothetical protein
MRDGQVAAGRQGVHVPADRFIGQVVVRNHVEHPEQHDRDRLAEVEGCRCLVKYGDRVADVGQQVVCPALAGTDEQRPCVRDDDRVVIHVHNPRFAGGPLRDLVRIVERRQPGPEVEELPDAGLVGQVPDHPAEEGPVSAHIGQQRRLGGGQLRGDRAVGGVVVLAAK